MKLCKFLSSVIAWSAIQFGACYGYELRPIVTLELREGVLIETVRENENLSFRPKGESSWLLLADWLEFEARQDDVLLEDVNLDGIKDVLVKTLEARADTCYRLFLSKLNLSRLSLSEYSEDLCGPSGPIVENGRVESVMHDGPFAQITRYAVVRGDLVLRSKSIPFDYDLEFFTEYGGDGKQIASAVIPRDAGRIAPAIGCVITSRAPLYDEAAASSRTPMHLVSGDQVTVLDAQQPDNDAWLKVRFAGKKKSIQAWINRESVRILDPGEESCAVGTKTDPSPVSRTPPDSGENFETRCGWFENPTLGSAWLNDRDGSWEIGMQGEAQAHGDRPTFKSSEWISTNGSYGYGCACMSV